MVPKPVKKMYVIKRGGRQEQVHFDKITSRIQKLCYGLSSDFVDPVAITLKVINGVYAGVTTVELDALAAETAASMIMDHPDYGILAARIAISNLHKETKKHFSDVINDLYVATNNRTKKTMAMISEKSYNIIMKNADRLNSCIIYDRDFSFSYFGFKLLEQSYLLKINGKTVERPQHMLMRVAVGIHEDDVDAAIESYNLMSEHFFIHASSTLFNAAKPNGQLTSSFIVMMPDDSIEGICKCLSQCAIISKSGGGIGVNLQNIRSKGTYIAGTNGVSNGLVPMLRVFNHSARYVDQGGYKRPGSFTVYLEPWHADVFDVLELKKSTGKEEMRAKDLFYALWIPDLFMKRVESNQIWSLMCPHQCQGLPETYGDEFEQLYEKYENEGRYVRQVAAQDLWRAIIASQLETGMPFILYKDSCNKKSNQKHLGAIRGGGLSAEVIQYSSPDEVAACSLASIAVNMFISANKCSFDFVKLKDVVKVVTKNLDKIIDITSYPMEEAKRAGIKHRPIGIGIQGLADTLILMRIPFDSKEAALLNKQIFETLYYGALESSSELAEKYGKYPSFEGSPASQGVLQYELWNVTPTTLWDWEALKMKIKQHGLRNSLLLASMPTASTSQILANSENISPYTSYVYTQKVSAGEFQVVNKHLLRDLTERGLWDDELKDLILNSNGSIQHIPSIPDDVKVIYKTAWEISQKHIIDMAADRGAFIDQSQSLNIHMEKATYASMSSMHFYGWKRGLKTGMYYLRTKSTSNPSRITTEMNKLAIKTDSPAKNGEKNGEVNGDSQNDIKESNNVESLVCSLNNPDGCEMCGA